MKKIVAALSLFEERVLVASLVFNTLLIFFQIIMRSVFNASLSWSEELARYIFIWQIWIGASLAYSAKEHIRVEMIFSLLKGPRAREILKILINLMWFSFNVFLVIKGSEVCSSMAARKALSSGMRIPLTCVYSVLPLSAFVLSVKLLETLAEQVRCAIKGIQWEE